MMLSQPVQLNINYEIPGAWHHLLQNKENKLSTPPQKIRLQTRLRISQAQSTVDYLLFQNQHNCVKCSNDKNEKTI